MTPSLLNFLQSIFLGTIVVIIPIIIALLVVSKFDPITRTEI